MNLQDIPYYLRKFIVLSYERRILMKYISNIHTKNKANKFKKKNTHIHNSDITGKHQPFAHIDILLHHLRESKNKIIQLESVQQKTSSIFQLEHMLDYNICIS